MLSQVSNRNIIYFYRNFYSSGFFNEQAAYQCAISEDILRNQCKIRNSWNAFHLGVPLAEICDKWQSLTKLFK